MVKARFRKGSLAAKRYMAKLRRMKKGSKVRSRSRSRLRSKLKISRRRSPMARRRRKMRSVRRRKSYGLLATTVLPGFAYGAARATVSRWLAPLTAKIPGGRFADNIAMGAVSWLVSKYGRLPLLKKVGRAGLVIESALLGQDVVGARVAATARQVQQSFR